MSAALRFIIDGLHARKSGSCWLACCPIHEGDGRAHNPSLSICERGAKVLVRCHGGCDQAAVIAALRARGLWPGAGDGGKWREWRNGIRYPAEWGTAVREYSYTDEAGQFLYSVVRFEPKSFRPGYYDGDRWVWKKHPRQVLYRLPEVIEAPIVFVTEGEKDVETLRSWGFTATTAAGGAKAPWLPQYTEALRGREVIIIPDMDEPGIKRGCDIARALLGVAARIVMFTAEDLGGCKDISQWFERGHSECELIAMLEGCHAV